MRLTVFVLLSVLLTACGMLTQKIDKPDLKLESVDVKNANFEGATLLFGIRVDNPNPFALRVDSVRYDVEVNGKNLTTQTIDTPNEIAAKAVQVIHLPLALKYSDLFTSVSQLFKQDRTPYRLKGAARIGFLSLPFEEAGEFEFKDGKIQKVKK